VGGSVGAERADGDAIAQGLHVNLNMKEANMAWLPPVFSRGRVRFRDV
jgi:hypothetical protein